MTFIIGAAYSGRHSYARTLGSPILDIDLEILRLYIECPAEAYKMVRQASVVVAQERGDCPLSIEDTEHSLQEASGRLNQYIASKAARVVRMVAGVALICK